ncbi:MAG: hypothetical protein IJR83_06570 [Clostridia bacterium]|nr:hypothetical protein [Clostridia bacterium]
MKKYLCIVIVIILLSVSGCNAKVDPDTTKANSNSISPKIVELMMNSDSVSEGDYDYNYRTDWGVRFKDETVSPERLVEFNSASYEAKYVSSFLNPLTDYQIDFYKYDKGIIYLNHNTGGIDFIAIKPSNDNSDYSDFSIETAQEISNSFIDQYINRNDYIETVENDAASEFCIFHYEKYFDDDLKTTEVVTIMLSKSDYSIACFSANMMNRFDNESMEANKELISTLKEAVPDLVDAKISEIYNKDSKHLSGYDIVDYYLNISEDGNYGILISINVDYDLEIEESESEESESEESESEEVIIVHFNDRILLLVSA